MQNMKKVFVPFAVISLAVILGVAYELLTSSDLPFKDLNNPQTKIEISNSGCKKWFSDRRSFQMELKAKNHTRVNYTNLMVEYILRDDSGVIIQKSALNFGGLAPEGESIRTIYGGNIDCNEIERLEISGVNPLMTKIDGDPVRSGDSILARIAINFNKQNNQVSKAASGYVMNEKYKEGIEYFYNKRDSNVSCTPSEKKVCLTYSEYQEICKAATSVTKSAIKIRAVSAHGNEKALLEGGSLNNIRVIWAKSNSGKEQCYVLVEASGIVGGNSVKETIEGVAENFIKNNSGEVLVTYFSLW